MGRGCCICWGNAAGFQPLGPAGGGGGGGRGWDQPIPIPPRASAIAFPSKDGRGAFAFVGAGGWRAIDGRLITGAAWRG